MEYELDMKYLSGTKAFYKKSFRQENKHCHPCINENYPAALEGEQRKGSWENCSMELGSVSLDASYWPARFMAHALKERAKDMGCTDA